MYEVNESHSFNQSHSTVSQLNEKVFSIMNPQSDRVQDLVKNRIDTGLNVQSRNRHKKALRNVLILAITVLGPLLYAFHRLSQGNIGDVKLILKPIAPFMMDLESGEWFTNQRLLGRITFLIYRPTMCDSECGKLDEKIDGAVTQIFEDMQKSQYNDQNKLVLQRVGFSANYEFILSQSENTRKDFEELFATANTNSQPGVFVLDRLARLVFFLPDDSIGKNQTRKIISKMVFTNYLDDYLSRRTFFGVKKDSEKK